jgi:hypothetical protein
MISVGVGLASPLMVDHSCIVLAFEHVFALEEAFRFTPFLRLKHCQFIQTSSHRDLPTFPPRPADAACIPAGTVMRVTNSMPLGGSIFLPVDTVNYVARLKGLEHHALQAANHGLCRCAGDVATLKGP